ncbi:MAG: hypothetical protein JWR50_4142 [Mucilaginibacter sp.]|nr:hypothetical protein [Mucilaginibacter sp.]
MPITKAGIMLEEKIKRFEQMLLTDRISGQHQHEKELTDLFLEIAEELGESYIIYRKHFPRFLTILEEHQTQATLYGIKIFQNLYQQIFRKLGITPFDLSLFDHEADYDLMLRCNNELERLLKTGKAVRISDDALDLSQFTNAEKEEIASGYISIMERQITVANWDKNDFETNHMLLLPLHQLLKECGRAKMYYYNVGALLDKFTSTEIFQLARNLAEETIVTGFKDGWPDLGFWVAFRVYAGCHNPLGAFLTGCISLIITLKKRKTISDQRAFDILWQSIRLYRNIGLAPWAVELYENKPQNLQLSDYRRRTFAHTYFTCLLTMHDNRLPGLALDFLNQERETLLRVGPIEIKPWLILLWQIERDFPGIDMSTTGLGFYLNVFTSIMPEADVKQFRDIIMADNSAIVDQLKESIIKLRSTTYRSDFVYDNDAALLKSNRVLNYSALHQDATGFLLAMLMKSDFSLLFQSKDMPDFLPFILPETDVTELSEVYDDPAALIAKIARGRKVAVVWLGIEQDGLRQLTYFDGAFNFHTPVNWDGKKFQLLISAKYFAGLTFDESVKQNGQVRQLFKEDFLQQQAAVIKELSFLQIELPAAEAVYLIKDFVLAEFPHNLLLDQQAHFIAESVPVTNVLSTEWIKEKPPVVLTGNYTKAIWIPTDSNDFTLHMLFAYVEPVIKVQNFQIQQTIKLAAPIAADLNIVCAHGADNISDLEVIQFGEQLALDLERFVGQGKILILFVCHSGSGTHPLFRNETANLIKKFMISGYEAVIAPAWALHIKVPEIWLPEFMDSFHSGITIDEAVFSANKKVHELFPTPAAWAALHLYGNPEIRVETKS